MKKILLSLLFIVLFSSVDAQEKTTVNVEFISDFSIDSLDATLLVKPIDKTIHITSIENISFTLPEDDKYEFEFTANDFITHLVYKTPKKGEQYNLTIHLYKEIHITTQCFIPLAPLNASKTYTYQQMEDLWEGNQLMFIAHGISSSYTKEMKRFRKKYKVDFYFENCVIDPLAFKRASYNNKRIHDFMMKKFGANWKSELPIKLIGFK